MVREEEKSGQMYEALHVGLISSDESDTEGNADVMMIYYMYVYLCLFWHADQMYCIFKSVLE